MSPCLISGWTPWVFRVTGKIRVQFAFPNLIYDLISKFDLIFFLRKIVYEILCLGSGILLPPDFSKTTKNSDEIEL